MALIFLINSWSGVALRWRQCAGVQLLLTSRRASSVIVVNIPQLTTPDPRSNVGFTRVSLPHMDQGSVLVHNTKTDSCRCDVLQPEVVPIN